MRKDLEARLLASARTAEQWRRLKAVISPDSFQYYRNLYDYIDRVVTKTGRLPRLLDIRELFSLPPTVTREEGEFEVLLQEAEGAMISQALQEMLDRAVDQHGHEPSVLVKILLQELARWESKHGSDSSSTTDSSAEDRLDVYERLFRDRRGGRRGLRTGFYYFDYDTKLGWLPGELIGVVGRTYVGKSWLLLYSALAAWEEGAVVLFISPEMPIEEVEARWDALYFSKQGIPVRLEELYAGTVPTESMRRAAREARLAGGRWITVSSYEGDAFTLVSIASLAKTYKPDLLVVDGLSLIAEAGYRQVWEAIKSLSYGLKTLAVSLNVPILFSHQANRSAANTKRPPALHEIAYGDAVAQACDRVLGIARKSDDEILVYVQKFRRGRPCPRPIALRFQPGRGEIYEVREGGSGGVGDDGDEGDDEGGGGGSLSLP